MNALPIAARKENSTASTSGRSTTSKRKTTVNTLILTVMLSMKAGTSDFEKSSPPARYENHNVEIAAAGKTEKMPPSRGPEDREENCPAAHDGAHYELLWIAPCSQRGHPAHPQHACDEGIAQYQGRQIEHKTPNKTGRVDP